MAETNGVTNGVNGTHKSEGSYALPSSHRDVSKPVAIRKLC